MNNNQNTLVNILHILVLTGFAVAQPLYDLIRQYPTFLVAHHVRPTDLILFVAVLGLGFPAVVAVVEYVAGLVSKPLQRGIHIFVVFALSVLIFSPILNKADIGWPSAVAALLVGGIFAFFYAKWRYLRTAVTLLAPAIFVFPALFLFTRPVSDVLFAGGSESGEKANIKSTPPIVFVVFDELTSLALMNEKYEIDADRFPNFAGLAGDGYWFRNATTNSITTRFAIPSLVTGALPPMGEVILPVLKSYPRNLFTLLEEHYSYNVVEPLTELCPRRLKTGSQSVSTRSLYADAGLVYLHVILPTNVSEKLPSVSQTWAGFLAGNEVEPPEPEETDPEAFDWKDKLVSLRAKGNYLDVFRGFIASINKKTQPSFNFYHCSLPHLPYVYLPSTKKYNYKPFPTFLNGQILVEDRYTVEQAYQRFLLQVQCVDTLLGELIDALEERGLYDRSLIIVTSDHGANYKPGEARRLLTDGSYDEVMAVPLLVKLPQQQDGVIDDRNAESIDVLPTIVDVLGIEPDWTVDGISLVADSTKARPQKTVLVNTQERRKFDGRFEEKFDALEQKLEVFGPGEDPLSLYRFGPNKELIGRNIDDMKFAKRSRISVSIDNKRFWDNVHLNGRIIPVTVSGRIVDKRHRKPVTELAVSVNGTIYAVTRSFTLNGWKFDKFVCLIPEFALREGQNTVEAFITIKDQSGVTQLMRLE